MGGGGGGGGTVTSKIMLVPDLRILYTLIFVFWFVYVLELGVVLSLKEVRLPLGKS